MPERNTEDSITEQPAKIPGNRYNLDLSTENVERLRTRVIEAILKGDMETMKHLSSFLKEIEALKKKLGLE